MSFSVFTTTTEWAQVSGLNCQALAETSSTNDWAKENASQERDALTIYVCDHQTHGRGRGDHDWQDRGQGRFFLSSWSFLTREAPQPVLSPALGLALFKASHATWLGFDWSLKAPNDLYLEGRKVAGLLIENIQEGNKHRLIVGLGMNVTAHPNVDSSGALSDVIPAAEITSEIWRQFLDRLLLEFTSTLLITQNHLVDLQCRGLRFALNRYPPTKDLYTRVLSDGSLEKQDGGQVSWFDL